jgi:hypothetical protein
VAAAIIPSQGLRRILLADAAVSACVTLVLIVGAEALGPWLGVPALGLRLVGLALVGWVALLLWTGSRSPVPLSAVWAVIGLNASGALACGLLAWALRGSLTGVGVAFMVVNGVGALALALVQWHGLRQSTAQAGA